MVFTFTDFDKAKGKDNKNCTKGLACGAGCISKTKKCKQKMGAGGGAYADHISDPANLEKGAEGNEGAESSKSSAGIETAKDAIAKGEQFLGNDLKTFDKLEETANKLEEDVKQIQKELSQARNNGASKEEINQLLDKADKAIDDRFEANVAVERHFDKIFEKVVSGDREKSAELAGSIKLANGAPAYSKDIRENASDLFTMSNGKGGESLKVIVKAEDRAYALKDTNVGGVINTGKDPSDRRVLFHEMAHHIEFENPKYAAAAKDFVLSRATGEEKQLKEITGNPNYRDNETAFPDKFISPYVGKVYKDGSTEVLSMGVEKMVDRETAKEFMQADREHFMFTVGVLKD